MTGPTPHVLLEGAECPGVIPLPIGTSWSIGRDPGQQICIKGDATISRQAAVVERLAGGSVVRKVGSSDIRVNGTVVMETADLVIGDLLQLGTFALQFRGTHLRPTDGKGASLHATSLVREVWDRERPGQKLRILNDADFIAPSNTFVGLLGPSGSGKTTLLRALSGIVAPDSGRVLIDGQDFLSNQANLSSLIGYVPQDDIVHEQLTVVQALTYSARLRLPAEVPDVEIQKLVNSVASRVGLTPHLAKRIKEASGGGLSGGQRKRVSVAVELLGSPRLLFLDEPTSGLDPATETTLMKEFQELAEKGCTVVCTTHVVENAFLMNHVVVVVLGGTDFTGDAHEACRKYEVGKLTDMYVELEKISKQRRAAMYGSSPGAPAELPLSGWLRWWKLQLEAWPKRLRSQWAEATRLAKMAAAIRHGNLGSSLTQAATRLRSPFSVLSVLLERRWAIMNSDWKNLGLLAFQPLLIGLALGNFVDPVEPKAFLAHLTVLWLGSNNSAQEIVKEIAIFRRERFVGLGVGVYLLSKFLFCSASTLTQAALIFACLHVFGTGWEGNIGLQMLCLAMTALAANSIGLAISAWSRTAEQALFLVPLFLIPQILFSGFVVPIDAWMDDKNSSQPKDQPVLNVVRWMPGYASQRLMDTSHYWGEVISSPLSVPPTHPIALSNLHADRYVVWGNAFDNQKPIWGPALKLAFYVILGLRLAWWPLRARKGE